jgi:hypothetical protein
MLAESRPVGLRWSGDTHLRDCSRCGVGRPVNERASIARSNSLLALALLRFLPEEKRAHAKPSSQYDVHRRCQSCRAEGNAESLCRCDLPTCLSSSGESDRDCAVRYRDTKCLKWRRGHQENNPRHPSLQDTSCVLPRLRAEMWHGWVLHPGRAIVGRSTYPPRTIRANSSKFLTRGIRGSTNGWLCELSLMYVTHVGTAFLISRTFFGRSSMK